MNEARIYKHNPATMILVFLLSLIAMGGVYFAFGFVLESLLPAVSIVALVAVFLIVAVFSYTSRTIVSEEEITSSTLLRSKTLRWTEIHHVSGRGYGIKLHNFDEDVTVAPSSRLPDYEEVIEWIGRKRPDLFGSQEFSEMKRGFLQLFGSLIVIVGVVGVMGAFLWSAEPRSPTSTDTLFPLIFLLVIIFSVVGSLFSAPQSVTMEGGTLRLKYVLNEKTLRANEIASIQYAFTRTRNGKQYFIALNLVARKTLRVSGLNVGLPIAYLVLKNWHAKNT